MSFSPETSGRSYVYFHNKIYFPPLAFQINNITFAPLLDKIRFVKG